MGRLNLFSRLRDTQNTTLHQYDDTVITDANINEHKAVIRRRTIITAAIVAATTGGATLAYKTLTPTSVPTVPTDTTTSPHPTPTEPAAPATSTLTIGDTSGDSSPALQGVTLPDLTYATTGQPVTVTQLEDDSIYSTRFTAALSVFAHETQQWRALGRTLEDPNVWAATWDGVHAWHIRDNGDGTYSTDAWAQTLWGAGQTLSALALRGILPTRTPFKTFALPHNGTPLLPTPTDSTTYPAQLAHAYENTTLTFLIGLTTLPASDAFTPSWEGLTTAWVEHVRQTIKGYTPGTRVRVIFTDPTQVGAVTAGVDASILDVMIAEGTLTPVWDETRIP